MADNDKAISELDAGSSLSGSEQIPMTQGGTTYRTTPDAIGDRVLARAEMAELIRDVIGSTLVAGTNVTILVDDSPNTITISASGGGGGGGGFDAITSGTNTTAAMVLGTGASLSASGSGTIVATSCTGNAATATTASACSGNAATATALQTARNINGTAFDGTGNITITAAAGTLTGTTLNSSVVTSSLTSVGTLTSLAIAGTLVITDTTAASVSVGRNGATNPVFAVNASVASVATGISVKGNAAAAGAQIIATSSGSNEALNLDSLGTSAVNLRVGGNTAITAGNTQCSFTTIARSSTTNAAFLFTLITGSSITASTEAVEMDVNLSATQTHSTGALTLQRDMLVRGSNHAFTATSTLTNHAALAVELSTGTSANGTITNASNIYVAGVALTGTKTNSYGLNITANSGATNNYAARLAGSAGEIFRVRTDGQIALLATNTAGGTTGDQTINKPSGKVNIAAAGTSITVTNSLCTTASIVIATVLTNDTTALIKNVVPGSGSFVITLNAAATAETSIGFIIIN